MSRENVEIMRRVYDAWNRGDLDKVLEFMDDDVEVVRLVELGYHGHNGVRRWWHDLREAFPDWQAEPVEIREMDDVTLATLRVSGRGGGSGVLVDQTLRHAVHWREGKIVRLSTFYDEHAALEALGLRE